VLVGCVSYVMLRFLGSIEVITGCISGPQTLDVLFKMHVSFSGSVA